MTLEFTDSKQFSCGASSEYDACLNSNTITGRDIRKHYSVNWSFWQCMLVLLGVGFGMALLAYMGLRRNIQKTRLAELSATRPIDASASASFRVRGASVGNIKEFKREDLCIEVSELEHAHHVKS